MRKEEDNAHLPEILTYIISNWIQLPRSLWTEHFSKGDEHISVALGEIIYKINQIISFKFFSSVSGSLSVKRLSMDERTEWENIFAIYATQYLNFSVSGKNLSL